MESFELTGQFVIFTQNEESQPKDLFIIIGTHLRYLYLVAKSIDYETRFQSGMKNGNSNLECEHISEKTLYPKICFILKMCQK